ncbi:MAG TPA: hypothetical protein VGE04_17820, partial [Chloroflexia bacterium]
EGRKLLYALYQIDDLAPVTDSFFDPLRQVARDAGIENFEQLNAPRPSSAFSYPQDGIAARDKR